MLDSQLVGSDCLKEQGNKVFLMLLSVFDQLQLGRILHCNVPRKRLRRVAVYSA